MRLFVPLACYLLLLAVGYQKVQAQDAEEDAPDAPEAALKVAGETTDIESQKEEKADKEDAVEEPGDPESAAKTDIKPKNNATSCYVCTSKEHGKACDDPFDPDAATQFQIVCKDVIPKFLGDKGITEASGCRKIFQEMSDGNSVVRTCAYHGEAEEGNKHTGGKGIKVWNYHCINEDFCNGAPFLLPQSGFALLLLATGALALTLGPFHSYFC